MTDLRLEEMTTVVAQLKAAVNLQSCSDFAPVIDRALAVTSDLAQKLLDQQARIEQLERMVETDELTGLVNRRGFHQRLSQAVAEASRHQTEGLVIYVDLDGFKAINDTYGHAAGDAVLVQAATLLKAKCRVEDTVARLGGDEFAILMPKTEMSNGWTLARALEHLINHAYADWKGTRLPIRASIGYVTYDGELPADTVISQADAEMYKRKSRRTFGRGAANSAA